MDGSDMLITVSDDAKDTTHDIMVLGARVCRSLLGIYYIKRLTLLNKRDACATVCRIHEGRVYFVSINEGMDWAWQV
jgi:hypothetical protein